MIWEQEIRGKYVYLRSVIPDDAEFILELRSNPQINQYLPILKISVEEQKNWIIEQQKRPGDYYFLVFNMSNEPIGTVRVYDIKDDCGESGSLALLGNAFENMEARYLLECFIFDTLGLEKTVATADFENKRAQHFGEAFGTIWDGEGLNSRGKLSKKGHNIKSRSIECRKKIAKMLYYCEQQ